MRVSLLAPALGAALALAALSPVHAQDPSQERLLVQHSDLLVVVDREAACGQPVPITVRAVDASYCEAGERLQHTVDGVRAMLGFECARLPRLNITGEAGPDEREVFKGVAGDDTGWLVEQTGGSVQVGSASGTAGGPLSSGTAGGGAAADAPEIAGVRLGMTVEEALNGAAGEFATKPLYRDRDHILQASEGGCDFRFTAERSPRAGWRCLEGVFTESETPRLWTLGLSQAVDQDQRDAIESRLVERFGSPAQAIRREGTEANGGHPFLYLAWDDVLSDDRGGRLDFLGAPLRKLEAYAEVRQGLTVVTLWHRDPDIAAEADPEYRPKF